MLLFCGSYSRCEAFRFSPNNALTKIRHKVISAAFVIKKRVGPLVRLSHQPGRHHSFQTAIECARAELKKIVSLLFDILHDAVPMKLAVG